MKENYYYKIVEKHPDGIKTLFHGVDGSRFLQRNQWLEADIKTVADGSLQRDTNYLSGWHIIPTVEEAVDYLKKFKDVSNKTVVLCRALDIRRKKHSNSNVFLSRFIYIY